MGRSALPFTSNSPAHRKRSARSPFLASTAEHFVTVSGSSVSAVVGLVFLCICVILASQLLGFRAISGDRTGSSSGTQGVELSECDHGRHALIQMSLISLHNPEQDDTASPANVQASALLLPSGQNPRCHAQSFCATVMGYLGTRRTPNVQDVSGQAPLLSNTPIMPCAACLTTPLEACGRVGRRCHLMMSCSVLIRLGPTIAGIHLDALVAQCA